MMKRSVYRLMLLGWCCLAALPPSVAHAEAIYTWVDKLGVTHFSETPPLDPAVQPAMIEVTPPPPAPPPEYDDYYSVIRQAERMERRRLENEKLEAERLQAEAEALRARMEAEQAMQPPEDYADEDSQYLPVYPYYPSYRQWNGGKPWRPGNWPGRPGHRPDEPGHWPGQPGHPQPGFGFRPAPHRVISAIPPKP